MKLLGLDIGDKRIGVAFGDTELRVATPVDVFVRTVLDQDVLWIAGLVRDYAVDKIVAGLPRNTDGTVGPQGQATKAFAERVAQTIRTPLVLWDEHLTTVEARRQIQSEERPPPKPSGRRRAKKKRHSLDAVAAAIILQDYMDAQANEGRQDAT